MGSFTFFALFSWSAIACASGTPNATLSVDVVLALDISSSMKPYCFGVRDFASECLRIAGEAQSKKVTVGLLTFGEKVSVLKGLGHNDSVGEYEKRLKGIECTGGLYTWMGLAVKGAVELLNGSVANRKATVIVSDGKSRYPDYAEKIARKASSSGVRILTVLVATVLDQKEAKHMERLASPDGLAIRVNFEQPQSSTNASRAIFANLLGTSHSTTPTANSSAQIEPTGQGVSPTPPVVPTIANASTGNETNEDLTSTPSDVTASVGANTSTEENSNVSNEGQSTPRSSPASIPGVTFPTSSPGIAISLTPSPEGPTQAPIVDTTWSEASSSAPTISTSESSSIPGNDTNADDTKKSFIRQHFMYVIVAVAAAVAVVAVASILAVRKTSTRRRRASVASTASVSEPLPLPDEKGKQVAEARGKVDAEVETKRAED